MASTRQNASDSSIKSQPAAGDSATHDELASNKQYTVVARRYRPRSFDELVGQGTVAHALANAIRAGRVGHAYLFTGARGVGKTSTARIFAKALNAEGGPTPSPDLQSDIAQAIDSGEDMDVQEIDGASNRGIEEIRQLRANVNVRPSRSRYKIYIIDEVHMLTTPAFNALLKTLEEPPEHVKFIFCTTDPEKIPITVLSRCQRFDFPPVAVDSILERLKWICQQEGFDADEDALRLIARRANGSMRDSQSLLEQVLAFCDGRLTLVQVHEMLGTTDESSLQRLVEELIAHDAAAVLRSIGERVTGGADPGQIAEQLLGYLRDLMVVGVGGSESLLRSVHSIAIADLKEQSDRWGLQSVLAAIQLLDETLVRMRHSVHGLALLEVALVQIAQLHRLESVLQLVQGLQKGPALAPSVGVRVEPRTASVATDEKKKVELNSAVGQSGKLPKSEPTPAPQPTASTPNRPAEASSQASSDTLPRRSEPIVDASVSSRATETPQQKRSGDLEDLNALLAEASDEPGDSAFSSPRVAPARNQQQVNAGPTFRDASVRVETKAEAKVDAPSSSGRSSDSVAPAAAESRGSASSNALSQWHTACDQLDGLLADLARMATQVEVVDSSNWTIVFPGGSEKTLEYCLRSDRKALLERSIAGIVGRSILVKLIARGEAVRPVVAANPNGATQAAMRNQRMRQVSENPFIKKLVDQLGGEIVRVDPPSRVAPIPKTDESLARSDSATDSEL